MSRTFSYTWLVFMSRPNQMGQTQVIKTQSNPMGQVNPMGHNILVDPDFINERIFSIYFSDCTLIIYYVLIPR